MLYIRDGVYGIGRLCLVIGELVFKQDVGSKGPLKTESSLYQKKEFFRKCVTVEFFWGLKSSGSG